MTDAEIREALHELAKSQLDMTRDIYVLESIVMTVFYDAIASRPDPQKYIEELRNRTMYRWKGMGAEAEQAYLEKSEMFWTKIEGALHRR